MKFLNFLLHLWVIFALMDPDPDSEYGSGSTVLIESGSNTDPDPYSESGSRRAGQGSFDLTYVINSFFDVFRLGFDVFRSSNLLGF